MKTYTIPSWTKETGQRYLVFNAKTNERLADLSEEEYAGSKYDHEAARGNAAANAEARRDREMFK